MKLLLICVTTVLVNLSALKADSNEPPDPNISGPFWRQSSWQNDSRDLSLSGPSSLLQRRVKRDPQIDNLKAPVDRLQKIARITNGIYLQQGLISGSIPADDLISELLFFEPVKLSDIFKMDSTKIQEAIDTLKAFPTTLKSTDPNVANAEAVFKRMKGAIDSVDGIGEISKWDSTDFKAEIDAIATTGVDPKLVTKHAIHTWESMKVKLSDAATTVPILKQALTAMLADLNTFKDLESKLEKTSIWKFEKTKSAYDGIQKIDKAAEGSENIRNSVPQALLAEEQQAYNDFFDTYVTAVDSLTLVKPIISDIHMITFSREQKNRNRQLLYTSGFSNGATDVSEVQFNLGDPWVKSVVQTDNLAKALPHLKTIGDSLSNVDRTLSSGKDDVKKVQALLATVNDHTETGNAETKNGIADINRCGVIQGVGVSTTAFNAFKDHVKKIDDKLNKMEKLKSDLIELLKLSGTAQICASLIEICKKVEVAPDSEIRTIANDFLTNANVKNLESTIQKIDGFKTKLVEVQETDTIKKNAEDAQKGYDALEKLGTDIKSSYATLFECLQTLNGVKMVFKAITKMEKIRLLNQEYSNMLDDGMKVVEKVVGVKRDLEKLKTSIGSMKGFKSSETDALNLTDASKHSKTIGESVQGVSNMQNVLVEKAVVEKVLNNLKVVETNQKLLTDPEDVKNLETLVGLESVIQNMFKSLATFNGGFKDSESSKLEDHSLIFTQAKLVSGLPGPFLLIAGSVGKLKEKTTDPTQKKQLEEVESSLKTMDSRGLDFAKFSTSLDASEGSLKAMDVFFAKYSKKTAPSKSVTPTSPQQVSQVPSAAQPAFPGDPKAEGKIDIGIIIASVFGPLILAGIIAIIVIFFCCRPTFWKIFGCFRKKKKPMDTHKKESIYVILKRFHGKLHSMALSYKSMKKWDKLNDEECFFAFMTDMYELDNVHVQPNLALMCKIPTNTVSHPEFFLPTACKVELTGFGSRFANGFTHTSVLRMPNGKDAFFAQAPLRGHDRKLWWLAMEKGTDTIFQLCPHDNGLGQIVCEEYVPANEGGQLQTPEITVICLKKEIDTQNTALEVRKVSVQFVGKEPFTVTHYWIRNWYEYNDVPNASDAIYSMMKVGRILSTKQNPIIHCDNGVAQSGLMAFIMYGAQMLERDGDLEMRAVLTKIREVRPGAIVSARHYAEALYAISQFFYIGDTEETEKAQREIHDNEDYQFIVRGVMSYQPSSFSFFEKYPDAAKNRDTTTMEELLGNANA